MSKKLGKTTTNFGGHMLVEYGFSRSKDGYVMYCRQGKRQVHLTLIRREGRINAHIKDFGTKNVKVWSMTKTEKEMLERSTRSFKWSFQKYGEDETYEVLDLSFIQALGLPAHLNDDLPDNIDLKPAIQFALNMKPDQRLTHCIPIRVGLSNGSIVGFQQRGKQTYSVLPLDEKTCFRANVDWRCSFLRFNPEVVGINRFFEYLERRNLVDMKKIMVYNPDIIIQIREMIKCSQELSLTPSLGGVGANTSLQNHQ